MAEGGGYANFTYLRTRRGNRGSRKPQTQNSDQETPESSLIPKILIKKRPPRRPKLENGADSPIGMIAQVVEGSVEVLQTIEGNAVQCTEIIAQNSQIEQEIEQTGEQMSALQLSEESLVSDKNSSSLSTPEKIPFIRELEKGEKRVRKPRTRQKNINGIINHKNEEPNVIEEPSTSSCANVNHVSKRKEKEEKQKQKQIEKRIKNKVQKSTANDNNYQRGQGDKGGSIEKEKILKEKRKREKKVFNEHLPSEVVKQLLAFQDPENPNVIDGYIRINPRCYQNAYVSLATGDQDLLIVGLKDRNRALEGDLVAAIINPKDKWFQLTETTWQRTGTVLSILEKAHPRKAVGYLKKQDVFVFLQPRDSRVPQLRINPKTVPKHFYDNPDQFKETLFLCDIVDWKKVAFAEGEIVQIVGSKGDLSVETKAILLENDLILTPYEDELLQDLPPSDYIPTETDLADREDLRETCIFTIDPDTAVDLDDAMSCKLLENGNFEVGIHIADVTHFLEGFSPLDKKVAERATTVYMVDNVYHMLPKQLCLACSLLPGQDKLAFSVILEMTPSAEIVSSRFAKTVINSCCQMAYGQAQIMIDDESYDWEKDGSLKITGNYKPSDLVKVVRNLYNISMELKRKRFDEGALRIDQPKLIVFLDKDTRLPSSYKLEERIESNSLIEEFMLLANMTVAKYLYETLPEVSLLRSHPEPSMRILQKTRNLLMKFGYHLDVESAGTLHKTLSKYQVNLNDSGNDGNLDVAYYNMMVINSLCAKSMTRAVYKCSASVKTKEALRHYALNAEYYTHFTSPIRRYPDCVVHRLLYASIKNQPLPSEWSSKICAQVATNCNTKKYSAKMAQEQSNALYFTYMLDLRGSMNAIAIVMDVKERSADAMLCDTGLKVRLYFSDTIEETTTEFTTNDEVPTVKLTWKERQVDQVINIFSILPVKITKHPQLFRLQGIILPPVKMEQD